MSIEHELKGALRRKPAPEGFAARVMSAARKEERGAATAAAGSVVAEGSGATPSRWWRAAAAAVLLTAILGGWTAHTVAERRAGEKARREVLLALHITGEKVRYAQSQVQTIGSHD